MRKFKILTAVILACLTLIAGCVRAPEEGNGASNNSAATSGGGRQSRNPNSPIKIGFSMDTLKEERWQRDKEYVTARDERHLRAAAAPEFGCKISRHNLEFGQRIRIGANRREV